MEIESCLSDEVIKKIKKDIKEATGNEIYLVGDIGPESGMVEDYELRARGNKKMVPALLADLNPGQLIIHNHPSGKLEPSGTDIRLASQMGEQGIGFAIIDNQVENIYVVVEPRQPEEEIPLEYQNILSHFELEGNISQHLRDYEYRKEQLEVVEAVIDSFNNYQDYLIEAGTGTGKSLAYLIPSLYWAHKNEKKVVVSTNTINLQEQLIKKDLVLLKKILPFSFKPVLVKGRNNYVCKRKLQRFKKISNNDQNPEKGKQRQRLIEWLEETESGTKSDTNFVVDSELWQEISSESDLCLNTQCHYFDSCYFMQARKEIYSAELLVVNHHLLLSDARVKNETGQSERGVLPPYSHLIIDEAHNFERVATYHLGRPFNHSVMEKHLDYLHDHSYSVVDSVRNDLKGLEFKGKKDLYNLIDNKIIQQIKTVREVGREYKNELSKFFWEQKNSYKLRLTNDIINDHTWESVYDCGDKLIGHLKNLNLYITNLYEDLLLLGKENKEMIKESLLDLEAVIGREQALIDNLDFNLKAEKDNYVFWLEQRGRGGKEKPVNQRNAPLDISQLLPEVLWQKLDNVVLTSATLTVNNNFSYFEKNLGLSNNLNLQIESPFNYKNQAVVAIPGDIPSPSDSRFIDSISDNLTEILISYGGKTMVLFTSYKMLNYCLKQLEKRLKESDLTILPQGRYPRHQIINKFKNNERQVIFGTVSFWEGIDIRGDDLKYLLMMKLPFPVPGEPIAAARSEQLRANGKNPFYHYSLPRAVIRFKQGFGRLIRSKNDKGMAVVFDNRVLKKSYGKVFLNSLPADCPVKEVRLKSLIKNKNVSTKM